MQEEGRTAYIRCAVSVEDRLLRYSGREVLRKQEKWEEENALAHGGITDRKRDILLLIFVVSLPVVPLLKGLCLDDDWYDLLDRPLCHDDVVHFKHQNLQ